jgi:hypothetical protein
LQRADDCARGVLKVREVTSRKLLDGEGCLDPELGRNGAARSFSGCATYL